jgi:peroxiredoxin
MVEIGEWALDFSLSNQHGETVRLSDYGGRRVILSFYPMAWTDASAEMIRALEEHWQAIDSLNAVAIGISIDSVPCNQAWAESIGIEKTLILSDFWPHGSVAQAYGIFDGTEGVARCATIVADEFQHIILIREWGKGRVDMGDVMDILDAQERSRRAETQAPII